MTAGHHVDLHAEAGRLPGHDAINWGPTGYVTGRVDPDVIPLEGEQPGPFGGDDSL